LGNTIDGAFTRRMLRHSDMKQLQERINTMNKAIGPLLAADEAKKAYWSEWEYNLVYAAWAVEHDKWAFYSLRTVALISSITVPSLVGLNLSGTGGSVVRWLTFALGLVTTALNFRDFCSWMSDSRLCVAGLSRCRL
jgi:hypothetical protein